MYIHLLLLYKIYYSLSIYIIVRVATSFSTNGIYPITKDGNVIGAVVIVDDLKTVDLEKIRKKYISG